MSKHCLVAYATATRQYLWPVELADAATVGDALAAARGLAGREAAVVPFDAAPVGIFGELCDRAFIPRDGDRIELYRPLLADPRERRRQRVREDRKQRR